MNPKEENEKAAVPPGPLLACTVLESNTVIGPAKCARGHQIRLPKEQAEALAAMTPPRVRIDGI